MSERLPILLITQDTKGKPHFSVVNCGELSREPGLTKIVESYNISHEDAALGLDEIKRRIMAGTMKMKPRA